MATNNMTAVWFNDKDEKIHARLLRTGYTRLDFKEFVKRAFSNEIDRLLPARQPSHEEVEKLVQDIAMKHGKAARR